MEARIRILYVDDSRLDRELVRHVLEVEHGGFEVIEATSKEEFESCLAAQAYDLVLSDFNILGYEGLQVLDAMQRRDPGVPVLIVTGTGSEEVAVEAMKRGAADYVIKTPHHIRRLPHTISVALEKKRLAIERRLVEEALRWSEKYFRALIDNALDLIMVIGKEGRIDYASPSVVRILGYEPGILAGQSMFDFIHPGDHETLRTTFLSLSRRAGTVTQSLLRFRNHKGSWRILEAISKEIEDETGASKFVVNARDISERRWAEEALRESEQQYRALIEQSGDAIYVLQEERYVLVNQAWEKLFGHRKADVLSKKFHLLGLVAPESQAFIEGRRQRVRSGRPIDPVFEFRALTKDGRVLDIEASVAQILWKGKPATQGVYRDVTQRKRAEAAQRRYAERLEVLRAIDRALLNADAPEDIADVTLRHIHTLIPGSHGSVLVLDEEAEQLNVLAQRNSDSLVLITKHLKSAELGELPKLNDPRSREIVLLQQKEEKTSFEEVLEGAGLRAMIQIPLGVQEKVIGLLNLGSTEEEAFSRDHVDIAVEVAEQLSVALSSAQLFKEVDKARARLEQLSRRLVEVQEQERRYLAMELHDEIGQMLTGLNFTLDMGDALMSEEVKAKLERARTLVESLTNQVRYLSLDLRPSMLDDLGLLPALTWLFQRYRSQTGVEVDFTGDGSLVERFRAEVETAAYRIIQEALNNVARYARVDRVDVRIWSTRKGLNIEIVDEGVGFHEEAVSRNTSAGLSGMQERAALVGGTFTLRSFTGKGTGIFVVLPH